MLLSHYETHHFSNPLLPFIYYPCYHLEQEESGANWHKSIEILCCLQGAGFVRCGGDVYPFRQDDIVVVNSDLIHTIWSSGSLDYCCFIIGKDFCTENGICTENLIFHNVIRDEQLAEQIKEVAAISENSPWAVADYRYTALGVLRKLCRDHSTEKTASTSEVSGEHIKQAITYIRSRFAEKLSLDRIAAILASANTIFPGNLKPSPAAP